MDHPQGVRRLQGVRGLSEDVEGLLGGQAFLPVQQRGQRLALDQLHHQVRGWMITLDDDFAVVVNGGHARVRHPGGVPGLAAETNEERLVAGVLGTQQLDRDGTAEGLVETPPHLTHAAGGDPSFQQVPAVQDGAQR